MAKTGDFSVFDKCKVFIDDEYWVNILTQCGRGKFPAGVRYDPNTCSLSVRRDTGREVYTLDPENTEAVFDTMMQTFRSLGLSSAVDQNTIEKRGKKMSRRKADTISSWKGIKSKLKKQELIDEFCHAVCGDPKRVRKMAASIRNGLKFDRLLPTDIVVEDGKIMKIRNVSYSSGEVVFDRPLMKKTVKQTVKNKTTLQKALKKDFSGR